MYSLQMHMHDSVVGANVKALLQMLMHNCTLNVGACV